MRQKADLMAAACANRHSRLVMGYFPLVDAFNHSYIDLLESEWPEGRASEVFLACMGLVDEPACAPHGRGRTWHAPGCLLGPWRHAAQEHSPPERALRGGRTCAKATTRHRYGGTGRQGCGVNTTCAAPARTTIPPTAGRSSGTRRSPGQGDWTGLASSRGFTRWRNRPASACSRAAGRILSWLSCTPSEMHTSLVGRHGGEGLSSIGARRVGTISPRSRRPRGWMRCSASGLPMRFRGRSVIHHRRMQIWWGSYWASWALTVRGTHEVERQDGFFLSRARCPGCTCREPCMGTCRTYCRWRRCSSGLEHRPCWL